MKLGLDRQRAGDPDALALPAGELVRDSAHVRRRRPTSLEQLRHPLAPRLAPVPSLWMLSGSPTIVRRRVIRGSSERERVLEDDLHLPPDARSCAAGTAPVMSVPVEADLAAGRLDQAQDVRADRRLARAGFADQADDLALPMSKLTVVDRLHVRHRAANMRRRGPGSALSRPATSSSGSPSRAPARSVRVAGSRQRQATTQLAGPTHAPVVGGRIRQLADGRRRQTSRANAQRGGTAQPCGSAPRVGHIAGDRLEPALPPRLRGRRAAPSVSRPARVGHAAAREQASTRRRLDHPPGIHHDDAVGDLGHDAEVVGDEQDAPCRSRCCSVRISSRICAWIVTSSAVVGSSAISSFGLHDSAMAIITRCRMPPDSWCG